MRVLRFVGAIVVVFVFAYCASRIVPVPSPGIVVEAQTLPYTLTVAWNASADATAYTCYLDGTAVRTGVTATTCSFPVAALGSHTVGVSAVNTSFVPPESSQATLTFTLKQPTAPSSVTVK